MRSRSDITALKTLAISGGHTLSLVSGDVEDQVTFQLERLVSEGCCHVNFRPTKEC